ncbi:hypothetical protein ACSNOK_15725 [Streptomyces sp. URMC 126]|uniref:hypothetical protein n=1 Tax=Streptomyces sp. URMC 126 TaxID=3423401 RepID=UPI003F1A8AC5
MDNTGNRPPKVSDDELVAQGNAICARKGDGGIGRAIGSTYEVTRDTRKKLGVSLAQAAAVVGAARAACKAQP